MARKALIVKHAKLEKVRQRYYEACKAAKAAGQPVPPKQRGYQPTKWYNRCAATGKTRSFMRDYGVSRQAFRNYARK
jgi:small subunit ribosomal protein S14